VSLSGRAWRRVTSGEAGCNGTSASHGRREDQRRERLRWRSRPLRQGGHLLGGIGVSGDTSCADHNIAWRTRHKLELDYVPAGVSTDKDRPDNIIFDISGGVSAGGFGHVHCRVGQAANESAIAAALPPIP